MTKMQRSAVGVVLMAGGLFIIWLDTNNFLLLGTLLLIIGIWFLYGGKKPAIDSQAGEDTTGMVTLMQIRMTPIRVLIFFVLLYLFTMAMRH